MYVSQYASYVQPVRINETVRSKPNASQEKNPLATFETLLTTRSHTRAALQKLPNDTKAETNYYANRYKLVNVNDFPPKELETFQKKSAQSKLQNAYDAVFTSLYDVAAPKQALFHYNNTPPSNSYEKARRLILAKEVSRVYLANDTFYQKVYAS